MPNGNEGPWRRRPNSFLRGYVAGSMLSGWLVAVVLLLGILGAGSTDTWLVAVLSAATGALGTFMWFHG